MVNAGTVSPSVRIIIKKSLILSLETGKHLFVSKFDAISMVHGRCNFFYFKTQCVTIALINLF